MVTVQELIDAGSDSLWVIVQHNPHTKRVDLVNSRIFLLGEDVTVAELRELAQAPFLARFNQRDPLHKQILGRMAATILDEVKRTGQIDGEDAELLALADELRLLNVATVAANVVSGTTRTPGSTGTAMLTQIVTEIRERRRANPKRPSRFFTAIALPTPPTDGRTT